MLVRVYMTDDGTPEGALPIAFVNGRRADDRDSWLVFGPIVPI